MIETYALLLQVPVSDPRTRGRDAIICFLKYSKWNLLRRKTAIRSKPHPPVPQSVMQFLFFNEKKNHLFYQLLGSCQSPNSKGTIRHSGIDLTPLSVPTHLFSPLDILFHFLFYYLPLKVWIGMFAVFVISSCKHRSVCSSLGSRGLQNRSYPSKALFCKAWRVLSMFQKALWFYLTGTNAFHLGSWMRASCRSPEATSLLVRKATLLTHLKQMTTAAVAHWEFERLVYGNTFRVRGESLISVQLLFT